MTPRAKTEDIIGALNKISDWFQSQALLSKEEGDHLDHVIRALALAEAVEEIERLIDRCDKQAMILRRLNPENFPNTLFIHAVLGERDMNNMPEKLLVVPAYGVDFSYVYERTDKIAGPEW